MREWGRLTEPYTLAGAPLTFSADTGDERVRATFGEEKYAPPWKFSNGPICCGMPGNGLPNRA